MDQANTDDQKGKALSFADVSTAIDNRRFLGDVSDMDLDLLEHILPHCSKKQLIHIEMSTKDRDLSPVTDTLWKSFYEKEFGIESTNSVSEIMKEWNLKFKWSELYREKSKRVKKDEKKEDDRKLSWQVRVCKKVSPSSIDKRNWPKSKLMKKIVKD
ncbi:putative RNA polymerase II transcription factor SIII, subunit A [Rosa chinensis]|uniref:Putative RNA polymerase II transcription factor SIII, subunit A n=1 Tax=Rosa chinensis TaxID=74649 RepID=A0A2P6SDC8_ROSCH|nr:putative RNA polymerase II transcription factor SIII, subunit A [Rosa chinensis]